MPLHKKGLITIKLTTNPNYNKQGKYEFRTYDDGSISITYNTFNADGYTNHLECSFILNKQEAKLLKEFLEENYCEDCKESSRIN